MLMVYGALIGLLNGFFGSGGGILAVTLLQKQGLPSRQAHATSIAIILPLSLVSLAVYYLNGNLELLQGLPFAHGDCKKSRCHCSSCCFPC